MKLPARLSSIALATLATASLAPSQSLLWSETSTSVRAGVGTAHTEHARPVGWAPFLVPSMSEGSMVLRWDYDVTLTNAGAPTSSGFGNLLVGSPFLKDDQCWGNDGGGSFSPFGTSQLTIPGMSSLDQAGSLTETIEHGITYQFCGPAQDGIHRADGQSAIFAGPVASSAPSNWYLEFFPSTVSLTLNSALFTADVEITTTYDLPLVAGSNGCDPLFVNSTGASGALAAYGAADAVGGGLVLFGSDLPSGVPGYLVLSATTIPATATTFGIATLCLGAPQYRWIDSLGLTEQDGTYGVELATTGLPIPGGSVLPGETWHVQYLHRDVDPATGQATANSTSAVSVTF